jgi:hypothetical protein
MSIVRSVVVTISVSLTLACVPKPVVIPDRNYPHPLSKDQVIEVLLETEKGMVKAKMQFRAGDFCADRVVVEGGDGG